ncbi:MULTISPECIES: terminase small subunit [Vibrio]|uniref:terminase small subunit n=1 Tax=Vibrio TaxID=662 RepID=UPI001B824AB2|nr:terminase small subunit [Vibrio parahaemolyticus]EJE4180224.1 terminase small subunit [Vibrio parahaemolyticus]MDG3415497.1 terminase small subunit [Vibrio parahaemolyticus]HBC3541893.1 terminase small subunit [Vibrio parahaemolyticus]HBC3546907.1 terminase small subunit [Vibrio parahaemolyticus]HBC3570579.1 terminase small subunit [Vibrio parahaemolyticus]
MSTIKTASKVEPHWLNKSTMAESLGISVQAFDKWGVKPVAKVGRSVYFTVADVLYNRKQNEVEKHQPKHPEQQDPDEGCLEYERYRLTKAQADSQELKNQIATQEVVPVDFATYALAKVSAEASGVIDSLPLNIVRKHPELTTIQTENIKRELAKALNTLSRLERSLPEILDDYIRETTE